MNEKFIITIVAAVLLLASVIADRKKTLRALQIAIRRFITILPSFLCMLAAVSIVLTVIPVRDIVRYLSAGNTIGATFVASGLGSITLMPGFIAFPLSGILLSKGVAYMVLSAFTTTLMMVGVLTYPVEKQYFGTRVTVIRNALSFIIAIVVALVTGLYFREILPL